MGKWIPDNIPDLRGKIAVVTGANGGIGFYTTFWLVSKGAKVIMASRSPEKAAQARAEMLSRQDDLLLGIIPLGLASLESMCSFSAAIR